VRPKEPNPTRYHSLEVMRTDAFLEMLLTTPPAAQLALSLSQARDLCEKVDVWRAFAGTIGYMITQSLSHSPKRHHGKRPGGPDLWQAVYLGVVEVFVTRDTRQLEGVVEISSTLTHPRCVVHTHDFLNGVREPTRGHRCRVCLCLLPTPTGLHANGLALQEPTRESK